VAAFLGGCENPAGNDPVYTVTIAPLTHGSITAAPEQAEAGCA
jgi:hypothetical protein